MGGCFIKQDFEYERRKTLRESKQINSIKTVFKFGDVIGGGSFGIVKTAIRRDFSNLKVAIKSIQKETIKGQIHVLRREVENLMTINHPNIVKLFDLYEDDKAVHLVMEYCSGGELFTKITQKDRLSELDSRRLMKKMLSAVSHLHIHQIVHRDIKPQNFLFKSQDEFSEIKLVDFGLSYRTVEATEEMHSKVGTIYYTAPEVFSGNYSAKCDVWSLGVILFVMLSGHLPFFGDDIPIIFKQVMSGDFSMEGKV